MNWPVVAIMLVLIIGLCVLCSYLYRELKRAKREQERLRQDAMDSVIGPASLAHEIRTPLTMIRGASELLLEQTGNLTEPQIQFCETIAENSNTAIREAEDFLTLFSLERALLHIDNYKTDLRATVRDAITEYRLMTVSDIRQDNRGLPIYIDGDARLLKQVIWNLLNNALRHGGPDVHIDVTVSANDGIALVAVEDNGKGCAQADTPITGIPAAYDGLSLPQAGSGLGLRIVNRIIAAHHGRMFFESVPAHGTRILIQLPERGTKLNLAKTEQEELV